jgi:heme/copper-type cytochrome/quinol oxidase subunit 2
MNSAKNGKVLVIVIIILILILVGYFVFTRFYKGSTEQAGQNATSTISVEELKKIPVPEPGQKADQNVAVPSQSVPANPNTESKLRVFQLKGERGQLSPNDFRAYQNDILHIRITAVDKDYDFKLESYNVSTLAKKGETKIIEFQAVNPGVYNFYCSLCQTKNNPAGKIVVVPK